MVARKASAARFLLLGVIVVLIQAKITSGSERIHRDTEMALGQVSEMFRKLFPLVPEHAQYVWKSNERGKSTVIQGQHSHTSQNYLSQLELPKSSGKRGPDCMRKCIAQGSLHPLQCHSLC